MKKTLFSALVAIFCITSASIFAADCGVCDPCGTCTCECEPCDFVAPCAPTMCAYNAPEYKDIKCSWDVFTSASYLYWQAKQEQMDVGQINTAFATVDNVTAYENTIIGMDFDYNSAFKVGLGVNFNCDFWQLYAEYTWYHHSFDNKGVAATGTNITSSVISSDWISLNPIIETLESLDNEITGKWNLCMDKLDVDLSRAYYNGTCLTFRTAYGLRGLWITQKMDSVWTGDDANTSAAFITTVKANQKTNSWAVGPKLGFDMNWNYCYGFRLIGNFDLAVLYTNYDRSFVETIDVTDPTSVLARTTSLKNDNPCYLRPQTSMFIGLGWGNYICCNDWYIDVQAGYEVQVYWNENMFVHNINTTSSGSSNQYKSVNPGNLYLHGLTVTARLDF